MDAVAIAILVALTGVLGTVIGVLVAELLAQKRIAESEARQLEREAAERVRQRRLRMIDDTRRDIAATLVMQLARLAGDLHTSKSTAAGPQVNPRANSLLINEADVHKRLLELNS